MRKAEAESITSHLKSTCPTLGCQLRQPSTVVTRQKDGAHLRLPQGLRQSISVPVEKSAAANLWAIFRSHMRCQNSFAASCGSALTSHGLVRAQEVTTCTRLSKWKISDEFRKQHMIKTALRTLLRLLRCPGRDGPQDFQLPFPCWSNFASTSQP